MQVRGKTGGTVAQDPGGGVQGHRAGEAGGEDEAGTGNRNRYFLPVFICSTDQCISKDG